jgi:hypothetical protein
MAAEEAGSTGFGSSIQALFLINSLNPKANALQLNGTLRFPLSTTGSLIYDFSL